MSIPFAPSVATAPPPAWLRYTGKLAVIEATGLVDSRAEGQLLDLAHSAVSRGCVTVVLNIRRARLDDCSIPVLSRLAKGLDDAGVGFAMAGQSDAARHVLERSRGELDVVLYPSVSARPPWSSSIGGSASQAAW